MKPVKPVLRYHGGKWAISDWILSHLPQHRIYVEPFGGAASVLLLKDRSFSEVYNDLDGEVVNLFRVLQSRTTYRELAIKLRYTPYSRAEFVLAYTPSDDPVERARRLLIRSWMGHSSVGAHRKTGYRTNVRYVRRRAPSGDWRRLVDHLDRVVDRLRDVNIESVSAVDVIQGHDEIDTLFYVDPPYPLELRHGKVYRHEMTDQQHCELASLLQSVQGMVVISGYPCRLYDDDLYPDWHRVERKTYADQYGERTEVLWISPSAAHKLAEGNTPQLVQMNLFTEVR